MRWTSRRVIVIATLAIIYGGIALGLWWGNDSQDAVARFRSSIPHPSYGATQRNGPRAEDFWAQQADPASRPD